MSESNEAHKHRRSSAVGIAAFDDAQFAVDVGHREHPEEKFLSYTRAKVKEALTKVRHVEHIGAGEPTEPTVMPLNRAIRRDHVRRQLGRASRSL